MIPSRSMRAALVGGDAPRGCGASMRKTPAAPPAPRAPTDAPAFSRGYDALSYALDLSLLDDGGSIFGSLVVEVAARRAGLTEIDLNAIDLEILDVSERGAPRRFALDGGHLGVALDPPATNDETRALAIRYRGDAIGPGQ
jgi:aminopeptidase N